MQRLERFACTWITILSGVFSVGGCFSELKQRDASVQQTGGFGGSSADTGSPADLMVRSDSTERVLDVSAGSAGGFEVGSALDGRGGASGDGGGAAGGVLGSGGSNSVVDAPVDQKDRSGPGGPCSVDGDCSYGVCLDGMCCSEPCSGCRACTNALTGAADGTCAAVLSGRNAPHGTCKDETATNPCGNDGTCDGKGACRYVGTTHECGAASCSTDGKSFTPAVTCDGNGKCPTQVAQDCGGALCTATSGCLKSCTASNQCGNGYFCNTAKGTCAQKSKNGTIATNTEECSSGVIADGVCCDKGCTGCSACTLALNFQTGSAQDGQCLPVVAGKPAPHSVCSASVSVPCGQDGTCDGAGSCHYPMLGSTCASPSCSGAMLTTNTCDSSHVCTPKSAPCGSSLVCDSSTACKTGSCTKDQDCAAGYCVAGSCQSTRRVGDACGVAAECPNGYCVDGYCCNDKCEGECQSCRQPAGQCKATSTPRTTCPGSGTCDKKYCDGTHASCVFPGSTTACPSSCNSDWSAVMSSSCDGTGSCGAATATNCMSGEYCSTGTNLCTTKIANTTTSCSRDVQCSTGKCCGTCVNPATDSNNCGSCGNKCGANRSCTGGGCSCTGGSFPSTCGSGCASWNFESGPGSTEGWSLMLDPSHSGHTNGATNAVVSSNRPAGYPGTGSYSLVVPVNITGAGSYEAEVGTVFCQNSTLVLGGYSISGYVYFDGPAFPTYSVLALYTWAGSDANSNVQRIIMSQAGSSTMETRKWIPINQALLTSSWKERRGLEDGAQDQA
jgi:hypothetical protein